jgi:hypothetical protein
VNVIGQVENAPWMMIKQGNAASGFVHSSFLTPAGTSRHDPVQTAAVPPPPAAPGTETRTIAMKQSCKKVEQTITLKDGSTTKEVVTACRGPNGITIQGS